MTATPPTTPPTMAPVLLCDWFEVEDDASAVVEARAEDGEESDAGVIIGTEGVEITAVTARVVPCVDEVVDEVVDEADKTTSAITNAVLDVPSA